MKALLLVLALALIASLARAAPEIRPATAPQPRPRLDPNAVLPTALLQPLPSATPQQAVLLEKLIITDSRLPAGPRPLDDEEQTRFSFLKGGPAYKTRLGAAAIEFGLWRPVDWFAQDAAYKPQKVHAEITLVRVKW